MTLDTRVHAQGWARSQKLEHLQNKVFIPYLDHHLSENNLRFNVGLAFIQRHWTLGHMPGVWTRGQNLEHLENVVFNPYLDHHLSESFHTRTRGPM